MATCLDDGLQTVYASVERQSACEIASNPRVFLRVRHLMVVLSLEKKGVTRECTYEGRNPSTSSHPCCRYFQWDIFVIKNSVLGEQKRIE